MTPEQTEFERAWRALKCAVVLCVEPFLYAAAMMTVRIARRLGL